MSRRDGLTRMRDAEGQGVVADSMEFRLELMERVRSGEITLAESQAELARVKRNAKKNGQVTRNQAFNGHLPVTTSADTSTVYDLIAVPRKDAT